MTGRFGSLPRVFGFWVVGLLIATSIASAQTPPPRPGVAATTQATFLGSPAFVQLIQGKKVVVTTSDGEQHRGVFTVSETGLVTDGQTVETSMPFDRIVKVKKVTHRVRNGFLIGLSVGIGIGATAAHCPDINKGHCSGAGPIAFFTSAMGSMIGVSVGVIRNLSHRHSDVIYDAKLSRATTTLAPILSPTQKGLVFSLRW